MNADVRGFCRLRPERWILFAIPKETVWQRGLIAGINCRDYQCELPLARVLSRLIGMA